MKHSCSRTTVLSQTMWQRMCWMSHPREQHCLLSLAMPWNTQWTEPHPLKMNQVQKLILYYHCVHTTELIEKGDRWREKATFSSCLLFPDVLQQLLHDWPNMHCTDTCSIIYQKWTIYSPVFSSYHLSTLKPDGCDCAGESTSSICDWLHLSWRLCATSTASHQL